MNENNNSSSTNTVLIVIVLLILVAFGVWWFTMRSEVEAPSGGTNIEVNVPGDTDTTP